MTRDDCDCVVSLAMCKHVPGLFDTAPTLERLQKIKKGTRLQKRIQEEKD